MLLRIPYPLAILDSMLGLVFKLLFTTPPRYVSWPDCSKCCPWAFSEGQFVFYFPLWTLWLFFFETLSFSKSINVLIAVFSCRNLFQTCNLYRKSFQIVEVKRLKYCWIRGSLNSINFFRLYIALLSDFGMAKMSPTISGEQRCPPPSTEPSYWKRKES